MLYGSLENHVCVRCVVRPMLVLCETNVCVMLVVKLYVMRIMVYACDCGFVLRALFIHDCAFCRFRLPYEMV